MTPVDIAMDPLRTAAMTLHALPARDREWLLARLVERQRHLLRPLLQELQDLGIPGDPGLLQALQQQDAQAATPEAAWPETLGAAELARLVEVLAQEPPGLTRSLLAMRAWNWAPQLLAAIGADRRRQVQEIPLRAPAPALQAAILQALKARCESAPSPVARNAPNRWQRARSRLLRWGGRT
ncbi:hypothetical protein H8N03_19285 [Ramlibacter sp. USB13]|uniref:Uncharacterized protein n=1 Tax=Ramlibacter cellulosilyticus TaxID=2764187 RepID=A0A923MUX1_9BURK|nr:hypothetical protein [Ramlibacter cellulosilyticus]MBC5785099.1 hypothetical protein [Ramlibacter cellulosilyticus]